MAVFQANTISLATLIASVAAAFSPIICGALASYINIRMKNLATRADAEKLRDDLKANTSAIKKIEYEISQSDYLMKSELAFRERQLSVLYGPVYGYLKSQHRIYELWIQNKLTHKNLTVKKLFKEQNEKIRYILVNNVHLLDDNKMQAYISDFFTSTIIFEWYAADQDDGEVPDHLAQCEGVKFPIEFREHIFETTERLKSRVQSLNERFALDGKQFIKSSNE